MPGPSLNPSGKRKKRSHKIVDGKKPCSRCLRVLPVSDFSPCPSNRTSGLHAYCRTCNRIAMSRYRQTEHFQAYHAEYNARPETRDRKREYDRSEKVRAQKAKRAKTVRGRLINNRNQARRKLRQNPTPERRAELEALIAAYTAELQRIDAARTLPEPDPAEPLPVLPETCRKLTMTEARYGTVRLPQSHHVSGASLKQ